MSSHTNRLVHEKSPYLRQHAHNPVDWRPWGDEAFELARREDKPVFLSIGYSTCHWCHVMERETFEDEEAARALNETFVCVKVDREERPDLDAIYMTACQMLTGQGGWPLTILLTPDKHPFFAGTYFPKTERMGRPGIMELTARVREVWTKDRKSVAHAADRVLAALRDTVLEGEPGEALTARVLHRGFEELSKTFDRTFAGFGTAPKFPTPHALMFLLRYHARTNQERALAMAVDTLKAMRRGGIFDQVGLGLHRYSTDQEWLVPHFEKMLYDQALLVMALTEAWQATGDESHQQAAGEVAAYVLRDLQDPLGGFYCAEDADSEGVEGKFYVWSFEEIMDVLGPVDAELLAKAYSIRPEGNYSDESTARPTGLNILHLAGDISPRLLPRIEAARLKLFQARERRVRPGKDDKVLADWNGLMIAALAKAGWAFDRPELVQAARRAADFVLETLRGPDGGLLHRYRDGQAAIDGLLDDYAFMTWGLIELFLATSEPRYLREAGRLNSLMLERFWDQERGGLYMTRDQGEVLPIRPKEVYDGAVPSGNSVALWNLSRLAHLTGDVSLEDRALSLGRAFSPQVEARPSMHCLFLIGLDYELGPTSQVVVVAGQDQARTGALLSELRRAYLPRALVVVKESSPEAASGPLGLGLAELGDELGEAAPLTRGRTSQDGQPTAYVCRDYSCKKPVLTAREVIELVKSGPAVSTPDLGS